ncbi:hypothetical protein LOTGIDRAFT_138071, partial [Lottia gigantea]
YLSINFSVQFQPWFKFMKLIEDTHESGLVDCDFTPCRDFQDMEFLIGSKRIRYVPNAGGNSVNSEVLSFELLGRCFGARLVKTEMEVSYFPQGGSITDYVTEIGGTVLGVSVTRAMKYFGDYTEEDAHHLLMKKLRGVNQSSRNTCESWTKQILHVWTTSAHVTDVITRVYDSDIPEDLKSNTLVLVSTAAESDFIFSNS